IVPRDRALAFLTYIAGVVVAAAAIVTLNFDGLSAVRNQSGTFWLIASLAVVIDALPFAAPGRRADLSIFPSISFSFAILLGWGLVPAILVQAAAVVVSSIRLRHAPWRAIFNAAQYGLALSATAAVLTIVNGPALAADFRISPVEVVAILAGAVVWFLANE